MWSSCKELNYSTGLRGLYHKTLRIRNVQQMDGFCGNLVSLTFSRYLLKHTSLLTNSYITHL